MSDKLRAATDYHLRLSRELAGRLADTADDTAEAMDRMAALHERIATEPYHPLHGQAAAMARRERRYAAEEREAATALRHLASQPRSDVPVPQEPQRSSQ